MNRGWPVRIQNSTSHERITPELSIPLLTSFSSGMHQTITTSLFHETINKSHISPSHYSSIEGIENILCSILNISTLLFIDWKVVTCIQIRGSNTSRNAKVKHFIWHASVPSVIQFCWRMSCLAYLATILPNWKIIKASRWFEREASRSNGKEWSESSRQAKKNVQSTTTVVGNGLKLVRTVLKK